MKEYRRVKIRGEFVPIYCDIRVLGEIQEIFGSIRDVELQLGGLTLDKDKKTAIRTREPSMAVLAKVLPLMVREGAVLTEGEILSDTEILAGLETNPFEAAALAFAELRDGINPKKEIARTQKKHQRKAEEQIDCERAVLAGMKMGFTEERVNRMKLGKLMDFVRARTEWGKQKEDDASAFDL